MKLQRKEAFFTKVFLYYPILNTSKFFADRWQGFVSLCWDKTSVCFPMKDPCHTDHFLSDSHDKSDICFMKRSEAASKKMYPLGLLESRQIYLLMFKLVNSYSRKHIVCNNLEDLLVTCPLSYMWNFNNTYSYNNNIHNAR